MVYDRYGGVVYGLCLKMLGSREDAEEVTLDVFSQIWRIAGTYDAGRGRVDAWIFRLARSRAVDRLRRREREGRAADALMEDAQDAPPVEIRGPESGVLAVERSREMAAAMRGLPEVQRQALELAYFRDMSHSEIASATGDSLGTVKTRIRLGLGKLREALGPWWNE